MHRVICKFCGVTGDPIPHSVCKEPAPLRVKMVQHAIANMQRLPKRCERVQDLKCLQGLLNLNHLMSRADESLDEVPYARAA